MKPLFGSRPKGFKAAENAFAKHEAGFKVDKSGNGSYELDANLKPVKPKPPKVEKPNG